MSERFAKLLEPGRIGRVVTRNKMLKTANGTSTMDESQFVGDRMVAFYERLAKGGIGYLTVESTAVEYPLGSQHVKYTPDGQLIAGVQCHLEDDKYIPGYQRLVEAVHAQGCPISIQLLHCGPWNPSGNLPPRETRCSSSFTVDELPGRHDFAPCKGLTHDGIEEQIDIWAAAAVRVYKAGFDAVELNSGTCHLGNTFLSRIWNNRDDEYGAQTFENRTRFLRRIIAEIRNRTRQDWTVTVLMNTVEYGHERGTTLAEGVEMAKWIADAGADGINCRAHYYLDRNALQHPDRILYPEPPAELPRWDLDYSHLGRGATVPLVEAVKQKVKNIPIWSACRLDPYIGEEYLRKGSLDFVAMTRRILADPELPNKVKEGRLNDIRWCHGCLHCFDVRTKNMLIECRVNATLAKETQPEFMFSKARKKKKVLVVGGGPSGMEAARVAASRGHEVVLYEKESYLGGVMPMAAMVKDLETEDITIFIRYMEKQLKNEGVTVHLGKEVNEEVIKREKPDAVVVAAGAAHSVFDIPGRSRKVLPGAKLHKQMKFWLKFFTSEQMAKLTKLYMPVGKRVAVMGGTLHGCELAEFLTKRKRKVTMVHNGPTGELGDGMTQDDLFRLWPWMKEKGIEILTDVKYERVTGKGLVISAKDAKSRTIEVDSIVTTQDFIPNTALLDKLKALVPEVYNVGSSREPGLMVHAMSEGAKIGYAL